MPTDDAALPLTPERIQFVDDAIDWKSAIRTVGLPLVSSHAVTEQYVATAIEDAIERGPYFDLGQGVAMPHARPEAGANEIALSFLRCRTPVLLLDDAKHPIDIFIMLAATDAHSHLSVIRGLVTVLTDREKVARLKEAVRASEVLEVFGITS